MAERNLAPNWAPTAGFGFLTLNSGLAIYRARGDPASILFVAVSYVALLLLFGCLRAHERASNWATMAGFGFLTVNSGLAIYRARGDPTSVLFVTVSYVALLLLFGCLCAYERAPPGSPASERLKRAVWPLTTLLTAAFSSPRAGAEHPMERQAAALVMTAFGAMACDSALAIHDASGGDAVSAAAVLIGYAALLALTFRFLQSFVDGRGSRPWAGDVHLAGVYRVQF